MQVDGNKNAAALILRAAAFLLWCYFSSDKSPLGILRFSCSESFEEDWFLLSYELEFDCGIFSPPKT